MCLLTCLPAYLPAYAYYWERCLNLNLLTWLAYTELTLLTWLAYTERPAYVMLICLRATCLLLTCLLH